MNEVQRTRGVRRFVREVVCRKPVQKYVTAGDRARGRMMRESRPRRRRAAGGSAVPAWAVFDLSGKGTGGYRSAASA